MPKPNDDALAAVTAHKAEIHAALADHAALLRRITDAIHAEGEHAQPDATGM